MITETFLHDFQVLDVVALRIAMPEEGLKAGMIGTIVEIWNEEKQVFEVEFCDRDGQTITNCAIKGISLLNISMEKQVAELPLFHQIAFAYRIVERLFPNYVQFVENEHFGNVETVQKGLDLLKEMVLTENITEEIEEKIKNLLPEIENAAPDTEDYGSLEATLSLDVCGALYEALVGILERDSAKISSVAFFPFNTAETIMYAQDLENEDLMLAEKTFQEHLLALAKRAEKAENILTTKIIMKTFESVFPILIVPKTEPFLERVEDLPSEFWIGTGFFVSEGGLFMSVAHNFKDENEFDFYAILVSGKEQVLKRITKYEIKYNPENTINMEDTQVRDFAVGYIDLERDNAQYLPLNFNHSIDPTEVIRGTINGYLRNKEIGYISYEDRTFKDVIPYEPNKKFIIGSNTYCHYQLNFTILNSHDYCYEINYDCNSIRILGNPSIINREILGGLSGSPVLISTGELIGVFFKGDDQSGYFINLFNPYVKELYDSFIQRTVD